MVETQTKNQSMFWLWSDEIDFQKRGDAIYWSPELVALGKHKNSISLKQVAEIKGGKRLPLGEDFSNDGDVPYIRTTDFTSGYIDYSELKKISEKVFNAIRNYQIYKDEVLISIVGTIGAIAILDKRFERCNFTENAAKIVCSNKLNPYYLYAFLLSQIGQRQLKRLTVGGVQPKLPLYAVEEIKILLPNSQTQQKVEQTIKEVFQLKTEAEKEYQQAVDVFLKNIKTHISEWDDLTNETQKAFWFWSDQVDITNRIDPDYYSGEGIRNKLGKVKPLADLAEIKIGKTPAFDDYLPSGNRRIMKFRAITGRGIDWENEERGFVKEEFFQKNKQNKLEKNDIVLGSAAHQAHYIGKYLDIVDELPQEFADGVLTVAEIMTIRAKDAINPFVLLQFLRSDVGYELIQRQIKGQTSHLYPKDVESIGIPEDVIKISKSKAGSEIEGKTKSSLEKARLSKQKLQEAKDFVGNLVKRNSE